jgi:hypothetical protein
VLDGAGKDTISVSPEVVLPIDSIQLHLYHERSNERSFIEAQKIDDSITLQKLRMSPG